MGRGIAYRISNKILPGLWVMASNLRADDSLRTIDDTQYILPKSKLMLILYAKTWITKVELEDQNPNMKESARDRHWKSKVFRKKPWKASFLKIIVCSKVFFKFPLNSEKQYVLCAQFGWAQLASPTDTMCQHCRRKSSTRKAVFDNTKMTRGQNLKQSFRAGTECGITYGQHPLKKQKKCPIRGSGGLTPARLFWSFFLPRNNPWKGVYFD